MCQAGAGHGREKVDCVQRQGMTPLLASMAGFEVLVVNSSQVQCGQVSGGPHDIKLRYTESY